MWRRLSVFAVQHSEVSKPCADSTVCAPRLLCLRRENPKQRNDEVDAQIRLEIIVRLTSPNRRQGVRSHYRRSRRREVQLGNAGLSNKRVGRRSLTSDIRSCQEWMAMSRYLLHSQRYLFRPAGLSQYEPIALMERNASSQIGQRKR